MNLRLALLAFFCVPVLATNVCFARSSELAKFIEKSHRRTYQVPLYADLVGYPAQCKAPLQFLKRSVHVYQQAQGGTTAQLQTVRKTIDDFMTWIRTEKKDCLEVVLGSYLSESMELLLPFTHDVGIILPLYLYREGKLKLVDRLTVQGISSNILGSYQCQNAEIQILVTQAPYDLAATVQHELDHLFRDKYPFQSLGSLESDILLDETLANSTAAFYQLLTWERLNKPNAMGTDFNFFSDQGAALTIWNKIVTRDPLRGRGAQERGYLFFDGLTDSHGGIDDHFQSIIGLISDAYFDRSPEEDFLESLKSKKITSQDSPFTDFITPTRHSLQPEAFVDFENKLKQPSAQCRERLGVGGIRPGVGGIRPGVGGIRPTLPADVYKREGRHLCLDLKKKL